jgi:hypothetical protein
MAVNVSNSDAVLTATPAAVLTTPLNSQITILKATVFNSDTVAHFVKLYRVPMGGTAGVTNQLSGSGQLVGAGDTVTLPLSGQTLVNQQSLQASADLTSVVNLNLSFAITP